MPDDPSKRLLTEDEHAAIVADRVTRETASLTAERDTLVTERASLQTALDAKDVELAAEKAARESAEKALADYTAQVVAEREAAAKTGTRVAAVREKLSHLKDDFFTAERAARWAGMDDAAFEAYVSELAAVQGGATSVSPPRESAMNGKPVEGKTAVGNLGDLLDFGKRKG